MNGQRFVLLPPESICSAISFVSPPSRNCAPGSMRRVLSGPFEDGSILATSVRGSSGEHLSWSTYHAALCTTSHHSCIEAAHSRAAMPPKTKKPSSGTKRPVAKPSRKQPAKKKQLATKKKPPPQKRPPPSPSSSSEDDNESRSDESWRNASAAECKKRWGACPYRDFGFDVEEIYEFDEEKDQIVEEHAFSRGALNLAPSEWKCPCTVVYTPPQSLVGWRTVSDTRSVTLSWAYSMKDDDEYRYEYNPADIDDYGQNFGGDPSMTVDNMSVIRALARQGAKKGKKKDHYFSYTGSCDAGTASFDVRIVKGTHADILDDEIEYPLWGVSEELLYGEDSMVFEVRLREATVPIGEWADELSGMVRHFKSVEKQTWYQILRKLSPPEKKEVKSLTAKVGFLEAENAELKRRLARYEGTAEDSDENAKPPRKRRR